MSNWKTTGKGGKLPGVVATLATAGGSGGGRGGGPTRHSGRAGGADDGFADEDGGLPSSAPCFLSIPALSLVLSPSLFYFGFSSVAAGGSADGGGMAVLDGVAEGHGGERGAAPGERFTIPCPSAGHGGVGVAGYSCVGVGMGHAGFLGKWGGREGEVEREKEI
eukprot:XP_024447853.1 uncharacterized protein LOC112325482 [Populus trichocarpa]